MSDPVDLSRREFATTSLVLGSTSLAGCLSDTLDRTTGRGSGSSIDTSTEEFQLYAEALVTLLENEQMLLGNNEQLGDIAESGVVSTGFFEGLPENFHSEIVDDFETTGDLIDETATELTEAGGEWEAKAAFLDDVQTYQQRAGELQLAVADLLDQLDSAYPDFVNEDAPAVIDATEEIIAEVEAIADAYEAGASYVTDVEEYATTEDLLTTEIILGTSNEPPIEPDRLGSGMYIQSATAEKLRPTYEAIEYVWSGRFEIGEEPDADLQTAAALLEEGGVEALRAFGVTTLYFGMPDKDYDEVRKEIEQKV